MSIGSVGRLLLVFAQEGVAWLCLLFGLGLLVFGAEMEKTVHKGNEATEKYQ